MKNKLIFILVLVLCMSLCACGKEELKTPETTAPGVTEHTFGEWVIGKDAACTEDGFMERSCECGEVETAPISMRGHTYDEGVVTEQPSCTEEGKKTQTCTECGGTTSAEVPALGHDWENATCKKPKTCFVCKATEGESGECSYKKATCTEPETCSGCGKSKGSALGCETGTDGCCIRCGKSMIPISSVLSAPMDSMSEIKSFVSNYYAGDCYNGGNFRLIFNTANGVILSWGATNLADKDIKYITFTIKYYNSVGDPAYDSITGKSSYTARLTGPVGAGKSFYMRKLIGYGSDIMYGKITEVNIEYMDGTTVSGDYNQTTWHNIRTAASPKECFIIES